jgi:hypothetical protein
MLAGPYSTFVPSASFINPFIGEDPVHPTLENAGQTKPPERKDKHQEIATLYFLHLRFQFGCKSVPGGGVFFLLLLFKEIWIGYGHKIVPAGNRIELFRIEIGDLDLGAALFENRSSGVFHC